MKENNLRKQDLNHKVLMQHQNSTLIGLQKIIEIRIKYMHLMEFYLITSHQEEVKLL